MLQTPSSTTNPLQTLHTYGQSVWLDYIRRSSITSGELQDMVAAGEIWGVTSNPAIFEKAIAGSTDFDDALKYLLGRVAIANAKLAYQRYQRLYQSDRWRLLAAQGAQTQRLLWASTGTKNPLHSDVLYVEELIGADTVNTIPPATLAAFREHGELAETLTEDVNAAQEVLISIQQLGISLDQLTEQLLVEEVQLFMNAFDQLLTAVEQKWKSAPSNATDSKSKTMAED
jgi:transaldolase / glucose-6-phosphate isomerase